MDPEQIKAVMRILSDWNPLGAAAAKVPDLDNYRIEAIDIIAESRFGRMTESAVESAVFRVINQAFELSLTKEECSVPATAISSVLAR
jgi:hypothetical protein